MKTYTITSKQVSDIHNAYCYASYALDNMKEMFKEDSQVVSELARAMEYLKPVRDDVMGRKDADFDRNNEMYNRVAKLNDFNHSIWSIYEIDSLEETSSVPEGSSLRSWYSGKDITVKVEGPTWLDLWKATDQLIKMTKDLHGDHVFIEQYYKAKGEENVYEVSLGS